MLCSKSSSNSSVSRSPAFTKLLNSLFSNKFYCCYFYSFPPTAYCLLWKLHIFLSRDNYFCFYWKQLEILWRKNTVFCHLVLLLFSSSQILFNYDLYIYLILKKSGLYSSFHQFILCHWSFFWYRIFKFWLILSCPSNYKTA